MPRFLLPVVVCFVAATAFADAPTAETIQKWISDLDHPRFRTRDLAMRNLRVAGPEAAPALAKAAKTGSAETLDRALRILGEMADGADAKAETAARRQLRRLADGESQAAVEARALLNRKRNRLLAQFLLAGVAYQEDPRDGITSIDLDNTSDLESVLPLLKNFPEVEYVSISNRKFTDAGAAHLAELPNLRDLNLYRSNIGDEGLKHLTGLKNLRRIPMGETRVTDKGLKVISGMTQLEYVGVRGNNVTDAGLEHIQNLTGLTGLYLGETKVTDAGLKKLTPFTRLRTLYLHNTAVTDTGLEHLHGLKDLEDLYLKNTKTTEDGRARLKEALPRVDIDDKFPPR